MSRKKKNSDGVATGCEWILGIVRSEPYVKQALLVSRECALSHKNRPEGVEIRDVFENINGICLQVVEGQRSFWWVVKFLGEKDERQDLIRKLKRRLEESGIVDLDIPVE